MADGFTSYLMDSNQDLVLAQRTETAIIYGDIAFVDWPGNGRSTTFDYRLRSIGSMSYDLRARKSAS